MTRSGEPRLVQPEPTSEAFWIQGQARWGDGERLTEGSYAMPFASWRWRRERASRPRDADARDEGSEGQALDAVRQRALAGDDRALLLLLRARRGASKATDPGASSRADEPLPPEVAAAMIAAGLAALGETTDDDVPDPVSK
ncbi:MAG: hypothetical protein AB7I30_06795 [Isosphaeraceae bacterium]